MRPSQMLVDLDKIRHNLRENRRLLAPDVKLMAVLKGNAYGLGAVPVAKTVLEAGADWIAVAIREEAQELRDAGIRAPILILGYTGPDDYEYVIRNDIRPTVYSWELAKVYSQTAVTLGKIVRVHIKIDTGLHRLGFDPTAETIDVIRRIMALPNLEVEGMFTHFATADMENEAGFQKAFHLWQDFVDLTRNQGIRIPLLHCANTIATIRYPQTHMNMVRVGFTLTGEYPCDLAKDLDVTFQPAVTLKSILISKRWIPEGTPLGYFYAWTAPRRTLVGTIPIGYYDGFLRNYFNRGHVLICGKKVPIIGKLCMDMMMIDLTDVPEASLNDEVILIGRQGNETITVEECAAGMDTINYEVLIRISPRVPRIYVDSTAQKSETKQERMIL